MKENKRNFAEKEKSKKNPVERISVSGMPCSDPLAFKKDAISNKESMSK